MAEKIAVKAMSHIHSDWSYDGAWSLADIASFFYKIGCRVVLLSEHDATFSDDKWQQYQEACRQFSSDKILLFPGIEYSDPDNAVHIIVWGISTFLGKGQPLLKTLQNANEQGGYCVLAHPSRREAWRLLDPAWLPLLQGLEIWNRKADGFCPSKAALTLLNNYPHLASLVGLDFHRANQLFPLVMKMNIAHPVSVESVFHALNNRDFTVKSCGIRTEYFMKPPLLSFMSVVEQLRSFIASYLRKLRQ
jgi:hypothetical protein